VLARIFRPRPHILLESCSSGGNRFDLGMLCYGPQVWCSDNTDPIERLTIQGNLSLLYPQSTFGAHVSAAPHAQTLRNTPLCTRGNVSFFGCLGYEMDLGHLLKLEREQIKEQIAFYKSHRALLQYGRLHRYFPRKGERESWQISRDGETVAAIYNLSYHASPARDTLRILSAEEGKTYRVESVKQYLRIGRFGSLVKHISPVTLRSDGAIMRFVDRNFSMVDGREQYTASGEALQSGISLAMQYSGTGYNPSIRVTGDSGSTAYTVTDITNQTKNN
jgi:alpha-galactosidase